MCKVVDFFPCQNLSFYIQFFCRLSLVKDTEKTGFIAFYMGIINRKRTGIKLAVILVFCSLTFVLVFVGSRQKAAASASGPSPSYTNAPNEGNCTVCHAGPPANSGTGSVSIAGVPATYLPGETASITVTTSEETGSAYGFQLTAVDSGGSPAGTFTVPTAPPVQTQVVAGFIAGVTRMYVEHTIIGVQPTQFGSKSWTFTWTAPTPAKGKIDFYAAGNGADGDATNSGDFIYTTSVSTSPAVVYSINGRVFLSDGTRGLRNSLIALIDQNSGATRTATTSSFGFYSFTDVLPGTYTLSVKSKLYRYAVKPNVVVSTSDLSNIDFIGLE